ncbi:transposase [Massilia varians]|uniref:Transposase n=1 Tax=Massilia varians TaxID=457921 RepID=A0ABM8C9T5_9BURK|nr:transposase [Massilia varians]
MKTLKKTYTPELKEEAVKLVLAQGLSIEQAAARVSIPKGTLANWVAAAKRGPAATAAPGSRSVAELEAENAKLRRQLVQAEMERDIVKKAAAYFAQESLPSTRG